MSPAGSTQNMPLHTLPYPGWRDHLTKTDGAQELTADIRVDIRHVQLHLLHIINTLQASQTPGPVTSLAVVPGDSGLFIYVSSQPGHNWQLIFFRS